jgi:membrane protein DedA with SNARE-associated domain
MGLLLAVTLLLAWNVQDWMQHAFYPVLLLVLVAASLGVPVPEDVPLIAAGVILSQHPGVATWTGTLLIALLGVMWGRCA